MKAHNISPSDIFFTDESIFNLSSYFNRNMKIRVSKRTEKGLLSGMYQLPNLEGFYSEEELVRLLTDRHLIPLQINFIKKAKHVFTHIDWIMQGYAVTVRNDININTENNTDANDQTVFFDHSRLLWVSKEALQEAFPLPTAFRLFLPD